MAWGKTLVDSGVGVNIEDHAYEVDYGDYH